MKKRIGYKATYNFRCQELTYEIGKTYEIDKIKICNYGFHYCLNIKDIIHYYVPANDLKILEIEDIGTEQQSRNDNICTNKIKILREVPIEEHKLFGLDRNNNMQWYRNNYNDIIQCKYDTNNNLIYEKYLDVYGIWYDYDNNNNVIHEKELKKSGKEEERWFEYDDNNRLIHEKGSQLFMKNYEMWFKYNNNNKLIYCKKSIPIGYEVQCEYDDNNNLIHENYPNYNYEIWYKYNNNVIYCKDSNNFEKQWRYDNKHNLLYYKDTENKIEYTATIK